MFATYLGNNGIEAETLIKWMGGFDFLHPYNFTITVDRY
jgi:hypothetical protein